MTNSPHQSRAFTLLETLIYIALFSLIISGSFTGFSALTQSADRNETHALLQSEGDFLLGKIQYELSQGMSVSAFSLSSSTLMLSGTALSSGNVQVSNFELSHPSAQLPGVTTAEASFTVSAITASGQVLSENFSGAFTSSP